MANRLDELLRDLVQHKLTRRDFIVKASALGLSMGSIGAILAACGGAATPAATETATATATETATAAATETSAATATASATETAAAVGQDIIVNATGLDIDSVDPQAFKSIMGYTTMGNVYQTMMDYELAEDKTGSLQPVADSNGDWIWKRGLYDSWTLSEDKMKLTCYINKEAKFVDGTPVSVDDWLWTLQRAMDGQAYTKSTMDLLTVTSFDQIKKVDDFTFEFNLAKPHPFAQKLISTNDMTGLNKAEILKHTTTEDPWALEWLKTNIVGNGAYNLKNWIPGSSWEYEPSTTFWDKANIKNKGVVFKVVPSAQDRLSLLVKGDVDIAHDIALKDLADLKSNPDVKIIDFPIPWPYYLGLNMTIAPFDKKEVRQAIAYATPYQTIIDKVLFGFGSALKTPIANGMPGSDPSFWNYDTDLNKAKQLLDSAGASNLEFEVGLLQGRPEDEQIAIWIQNNLQQIGVSMKINKMIDAQFYDLYNAKQLQAFMLEWYSWVNDPMYHVYWLFKSDSPTNATGFANAEVDQLINDGMYENDPAKRDQMVKRIQEIIVDESPWVFLYQKHWLVAARKNVMHYSWYPDQAPRFMHTYKA